MRDIMRDFYYCRLGVRSWRHTCRVKKSFLVPASVVPDDRVWSRMPLASQRSVAALLSTLVA